MKNVHDDLTSLDLGIHQARDLAQDLDTDVFAQRYALAVVHATIRSTQPCIPPGSLNRVPAWAGLRAGMSPLPAGR